VNNNLTDIDRLVFFILGAGMVLVFFSAIPFTGLFFVVSRVTKKRWIVYTVSIITAVLLLLAGGDLQKLTVDYFRQIWSVLKAVANNAMPVGVDWLTLVRVGLPVGVLAFLIVEMYIASRPEWIKRKNKPGRISGDIFKGKTLKKLNKLQHPENGTALGVDTDGKAVILTDEELNGHCLVLGATGAGKTTTLMNFVESVLMRKIPLILVDGKGEREFADKVRKLALKCGRKFYLFTMADDGSSMHYNPLRHGNFTELKDKLISITEWTEPHYKLMAERYLQSAVRVLMLANENIDLVNVSEKVEPEKLEIAVKRLPENISSRTYSIIDESEKDIGGLINRLAVFSESEIGYLLEDTQDNNTIDLIGAIEENAVVFFSLDSLRFSEYSRLLGKLIVIDLKTTAARMFGEGKKIYSIFDEFGVFAGPQVTNFINKSRGAGFHVILSTQELADLRIDGKTELMEQILGNTNVKIIHRQDVPASAELLSSLIGTEDDMTVTYQVNNVGTTGMGTIKEERSFIVHPDEIKRLEVGQTFILKKFPVFEIKKVRIKRNT